MKKTIMAVGTTRWPKLNAVWEALTVVGPVLDIDAQFDIAAVEVPSGVRHTPLTRDEIMAGARNRVEALQRIARENNEPWEYLIGLEGGLDVAHAGTARLVFLENWVCVADKSGRSAFGQSGAVAVPDHLAKTVIDDGVELSEAIDDFASGHRIRDAQGTWGILTRNMITRQDAFRVAVINAFAPFFNRDLYSS
ncbi:MAG TPA: inosine/xanthosine triphosphatase [Candidatus Acidoferrum sp.]|nr:inosine/xanthosine triphosphatase [Candidatus Acidoferrum sp.]